MAQDLSGPTWRPGGQPGLVSCCPSSSTFLSLRTTTTRPSWRCGTLRQSRTAAWTLTRSLRSATPMCEPSRFVAAYRAVIEQSLGVTAHVAEDERAVMFTYGEIVYVLRNTAPQNPGLLDI